MPALCTSNSCNAHRLTGRAEGAEWLTDQTYVQCTHSPCTRVRQIQASSPKHKSHSTTANCATIYTNAAAIVYTAKASALPLECAKAQPRAIRLKSVRKVQWGRVLTLRIRRGMQHRVCLHVVVCCRKQCLDRHIYPKCASRAAGTMLQVPPHRGCQMWASIHNRSNNNSG